MNRSTIVFAVAVALLVTTGAVLALPVERTEIVPAARFEAFPAAGGGWQGASDVPADLVPADPQARHHLLRAYHKGADTVWLSAGYYPRQSESERPPVVELLFPRQGWSDLDARDVRIPLGARADRSIPATLIVMRTGHHRLALVYWYQIGAETIGSDHLYRATLVWNRLIHRRSDGALVRLVSPIGGTDDPAIALARFADFVGVFHQEIVRSLPD